MYSKLKTCYVLLNFCPKVLKRCLFYVYVPQCVIKEALRVRKRLSAVSGVPGGCTLLCRCLEPKYPEEEQQVLFPAEDLF